MRATAGVNRYLTSLIGAASIIVCPALAQTRQARLGRCSLELGGTIQDCRLGYQTFGRWDPSRRNAILVPTWFASSAGSWVGLLGPSGIVDTTQFFTVIVESLGAASSSSPTNSPTQSGLGFPEVTVGDMVGAAYRLAQGELHLPELYAVVGISLGGNQAFEWAVSHPDYVRRIVPIVGTPRLATWDRALWELIARTADAGVRGTVSADSTASVLARLLVLGISSPDAVNQPTTQYTDVLAANTLQMRGANLFEWAWQARAILRHDVARHFGGDLSAAASRWHGRALVVTATNDHSHNPQPAQGFARLLRADTLIIASTAGHGAIFSDSAVQTRIREWLKQ